MGKGIQYYLLSLCKSKQFNRDIYFIVVTVSFVKKRKQKLTDVGL